MVWKAEQHGERSDLCEQQDGRGAAWGGRQWKSRLSPIFLPRALSSASGDAAPSQQSAFELKSCLAAAGACSLLGSPVLRLFMSPLNVV